MNQTISIGVFVDGGYYAKIDDKLYETRACAWMLLS